MPLPTLLTRGMYEFPEGSVITEDDKKMLISSKPIDIILKIMNEKLSKIGIYNRQIYLKIFTGGGKSTIFPPYVYENICKKTNRAILIAEPRVNLCNNGINDIHNYYRDWSIGKELSIHTGQVKINSSEKSYIDFTTTQIAQNFLDSLFEAEVNGESSKVRKLLNQYVVIAIDEAHILEQQTLNVMSSIKKLLTKFSDNPSCPLVVMMSATMNENQYIKYLNVEGTDRKNLVSIVKGVPNFPIEVNSLSDNLVEYLNRRGIGESIYELKFPQQIEKVSNSEDKLSKFKDPKSSDKQLKSKKFIINPFITIGQFFIKFCFDSLWKSNSFVYIDEFERNFQCRDTLIFVPGLVMINTVAHEIYRNVNQQITTFKLTKETTEEELLQWRDENRGKKRVLIMGYSADFSKLSLKLLETPYEVNEDVLEFETKIIITTSVIETGKTLLMLRLCIDAGLDTKMIYNPLIYNTKDKWLIRIPANQSQIQQRRGRVGRKSPGIFLMMYSKNTYNSLFSGDFPETINSGCLSEMLFNSVFKKIQKPTRIDICNYNDYLYPISPDLLIRSMNDLFFGNIVGCNGEYNLNKSENKWMIYAQLAYYLLKLPLFKSIMIAAINKYTLPNTFQISDFSIKTFRYDINSCINSRYAKSIEFMIEGRRLFVDILSGKSKLIIPYRKDWY